jgi:hypothetical protein
VAEGRDGFAKVKGRKKKKSSDSRGGGGFIVSRWFFSYCLPPGLPFLSPPRPCFLRRGHASTTGSGGVSGRQVIGVRRHRRAGLITAGVSPPCRNLIPLLPGKPSVPRPQKQFRPGRLGA